MDKLKTEEGIKGQRNPTCELGAVKVEIVW